VSPCWPRVSSGHSKPVIDLRWELARAGEWFTASRSEEPHRAAHGFLPFCAAESRPRGSVLFR